MARLTEEMVIARSKQSDLSAIKKLNCWGAELGDVSVLRRMPNVEVVALSINKIRSLADFSWCRRLRELYLRKNEVRSLAELRHLRRLPLLTSLWLDENPCTQHPDYRMTVLRNLPNLEKLDNTPVHPDEVAEAMRRGEYIPDSDDEGYSQQEQYTECRRRSCDSSPERARLERRLDQGSDSSEAEAPPDAGHEDAQYVRAPPSPPAAEPPPAMTRSHCDSRSSRDEGSMRHSVSAQSVKEYSYSNGEHRGVTSPQHYHEPCERTHDRCAAYPRGAGAAGGGSEVWGEAYPSAVMAERRGFTRRPVTRNSNLLSAVLCLVKELDYPSLEVVEMAVRCRMDELANGQ